MRLPSPAPADAVLKDGSERFRVSQRLRSSAEFALVFADPQRSSDSFFTVLARQTNGAGARLGLAISRRAARRAVARNRLKRIARETFRREPALPPWDFVVMARPAAQEAGAAELRASLQRHFRRLAARAGQD